MDIERARELRKQCRFSEAAAAAQEIADSAVEDCTRAQALCLLAVARYCCDQPQESQKAIDEALTISGKLKSEKLQGHALRISGVLHWMKGSYSEAITSFRLAVRIAVDQGDQELFYLSSISIGSALVYMGEFEEAIETLTQAAATAGEHEDWHQLAVAHTNLGVAYCSLGNPDRALIHHIRTRDIYRQYPDAQRMALCQMNIAVIHAEKENYEEALSFCASALTYLPEHARPLIRGAIYSNTGQSLYWLDRIPEAFEALEKGLRAFEEVQYIPGKTETLPYLGCCMIRMDRKEEGLELCKEAMRLVDGVGRKDIKLTVRLLVGCGYYLAGEMELAATHLGAVQAMAQISGMKRIEKYALQFLDRIPE